MVTKLDVATQAHMHGHFLDCVLLFLAHGRNVSNRVYLDLPGNLTDLNDFMCYPMNRKGLICSECIDGFAPAITSLAWQLVKFECVKIDVIIIIL